MYTEDSLTLANSEESDAVPQQVVITLEPARLSKVTTILQGYKISKP